MIIDNIKALLLSIIFVLLLLSVCAGVDYAADDNDTISNINQSEMSTRNCTLVKGIHYDTTVLNKTGNTVKGFGKLHYVYPEISMWAKPSVRSNYAYRWYYKTFIDYCPICHKKSRWITHFTLKHDQDHKERIFNKSKLFDDRL